MGYQEYIYKLDNDKTIKKFVENRKKINDFIDKRFYELVDYCIVDFKEDFQNIDKGIYLYTFGDRAASRIFINYLDREMLGISSYAETIEETLGIKPFAGDNGNGEKLIQLFNERSTPFARVVYERESSKDKNSELERSIF